MSSQLPQPTGRPNARMRQTVGDMARSLLVVFAFVIAILLVTHRAAPEAVKVVATAPVVAAAVSDAEYPVLAPVLLPEQWRATSARWETTARSGSDRVLHIGYVTPNDGYGQVSQSANVSAEYLAEQTDDGAAVGTQRIAQDVWERWESTNRRSLVRVTGGSSVVVSGTASWDELIALAGALQVQAAPAQG